MTVNIAKDFSITPGPRTISEGSYSAELFLNTILRAAFKNVLSQSKVLTVNLDGTAGFATSFLEESFGCLQRENPSIIVEDHIHFISEEEPYLLEEILEYISNARK